MSDVVLKAEFKNGFRLIMTNDMCDLGRSTASNTATLIFALSRCLSPSPSMSLSLYFLHVIP